MQFYTLVGMYFLFSGTWGLIQMYQHGKPPIRVDNKHLFIKDPAFVKKFFTTKHLCDLATGFITIAATVARARGIFYLLMIGALCLSIALASLSIYVTHSQTVQGGGRHD